MTWDFLSDSCVCPFGLEEGQNGECRRPATEPSWWRDVTARVAVRDLIGAMYLLPVLRHLKREPRPWWLRLDPFDVF